MHEVFSFILLLGAEIYTIVNFSGHDMRTMLKEYLGIYCTPGACERG